MGTRHDLNADVSAHPEGENECFTGVALRATPVKHSGKKLGMGRNPGKRFSNALEREALFLTRIFLCCYAAYTLRFHDIMHASIEICFFIQWSNIWQTSAMLLGTIDYSKN